MPLQIRRGTDAERLAMTQPLAQGELLLVTTPGSERLYIGNGSTLGGLQITGYTNADARDAAASIVSAGTHTGISFSYNTTTDALSATVDLSNYQGVITANAFKGSVFADDGSTIGGTILVDAVAGIIPASVVSGTFTGNTTGYHTGDVKGSVFADDSSLIVDAVSNTVSASSITGNIFTNLIDSENSSAISFTPSVIFNASVTVDDQLNGNVIGDVTGNLTGNVFSTAVGGNIVDSGNGSVNTPSLNMLGSISTLTSPNVLFADVPLFVHINSAPIANYGSVSVLGVNNTGTHTAAFALSRQRGSLPSPSSVLNGDDLGTILVTAFDGADFTVSAGINTVADGVVSIGIIPSRIEISTMNIAGVRANRLSIKNSAVEFAVPPRLPVVANDAARTALVPTPDKGMMIIMTLGTAPAATDKVQVYDGSAWVNLH